MKKLNLISVVFAFFLLTGTINAQNTCISDVTHTADASAVLDVYSTSRGMLVPRMNTAPASPATGLLYYDTGSNSYKYYNGTAWTELSFGSLWSRSGTDTYLTNTGDNVVIGTNASPAPGVKFYVHGAAAQVLQFDGKAEFFNIAASAGGNLCAEIDRIGAAAHGIINIYNGAATNTISLYSAGNSYFTGGNLGIGISNPGFLLHVRDNAGVSPQMQIENFSNPVLGNTSLNYATTALNLDYTEGIDNSESSFKLVNTPGLNPSSQGDGATMYRAFNSGIVDFNNQSRARAWQGQNPNAPLGLGQVIPFNIWTPVDFEFTNYDQQVEFTLHTVGTPYSGGGGPAQAFFTATEEGYYQVNSRCDFRLVNPETGEEITNPYQHGYVSIAIIKTDNTGITFMYAQGNKLQGSDNNTMGNFTDLPNNIAPNVSDVVYLKQGEQIEIWVYQNLWGIGLPLWIGPNLEPPVNIHRIPSQVYVSVHKVS